MTEQDIKTKDWIKKLIRRLKNEMIRNGTWDNQSESMHQYSNALQWLDYITIQINGLEKKINEQKKEIADKDKLIDSLKK